MKKTKTPQPRVPVRFPNLPFVSLLSLPPSLTSFLTPEREKSTLCPSPLERKATAITQPPSINRQQLHVAPPIPNPARLNQLLPDRIQKLVRGTDRTIADTGHDRDLLGRLGLSHQGRGHVDARRRGRERRATSERADERHSIRELLRHARAFGREAEVAAVPDAELLRLGGCGGRVGVVWVDDTCLA